MKLTEKQKEARRTRYKNATNEEKTFYAKYQKENYKSIGASFRRAEAVYIAEILSAHGVTPAQVIRGAAAALLAGEPIRTEPDPLTIPDEATTPDGGTVTESESDVNAAPSLITPAE